MSKDFASLYMVILKQILSGRSMLSTTLNPGTNFFIFIACPFASCMVTNSVCIVDDALAVCLQLL